MKTTILILLTSVSIACNKQPTCDNDEFYRRGYTRAMESIIVIQAEHYTNEQIMERVQNDCKYHKFPGDGLPENKKTSKL